MSNSSSDRQQDKLPTPIHEFIESSYGEVKFAKKLRSAQQEMVHVVTPSCTMVVRIYKASSRWWNLHQSSNNIEDIKDNELEGYRIARRLLPDLKIPRVYHQGSQWALLEYIEGGDAYWMQSMVTVRHEFGFDEPHPRWGRVPESRSLEYALLVLHQVILPLHQRYLQSNLVVEGSRTIFENMYTYSSMIPRYQTACRRMEGFITKEESALYPSVKKLEKAIERLEQMARSVSSAIPPVLLHLDLQPQNLLFSRAKENAAITIHSVLDWEDAAIGDARFELMLLGRKVCANQSQAQHLWDTYEKVMKSSHPKLSLGPLEPWLLLETVHSLTTLLLEATRCSDGRASEGQPPVVGKLEREWKRLAMFGWADFE